MKHIAILIALIIQFFFLLFPLRADPRNTLVVDKQGQARAQLFLGEDGSGNFHLRDGSGTVRVKLGVTPTGAGLIFLMKMSSQRFGRRQINPASA